MDDDFQPSCALCGANDKSASDAIRSYSSIVPGVTLCSECAERAANAYHYKHAGEWLTWENKTEDQRYKKAGIPHDLRRAVYERDAYRCVHCGTHIDLTLDHIKPECLGGETTSDNLQTLCRSCNSKKGKRYE